ncbi:hypothetical protein [Pseudolactococcus insecticola]|uniref:UDP-N-acetylglucosamine 1-carboxyvinyltransferase n=1 Tax=Pseudolactococcus insecticola TaxID=2709158 RepID=A0A6A0B7F8_9LACT|nr:hypothetical protein [Lactococcus insecticola]GFH40695.1 hypothetical protein Hs20B_10930 [Lactococcus insecticola]
MGEFKIIGNRDADGNFVASADAWPPEKIEALFDRYNPNRKLRLAREKLAAEQNKQADSDAVKATDNQQENKKEDSAI